jgi:hypothetical protein
MANGGPSGDYTHFGLAYLYPVAHNAAGKNYEPVIAQPLYITSVTVPGAPKGFCNGTTTCNMLLVATLSDYVYAFDTSTPPAPGAPNYLWPPINLVQNDTHCGSQHGGPFNNRSTNGFPGVANLAYYGVVATPAVDTVVPTNPTAFVVSACVDTVGAPLTIKWFLDAIDLTNGTVVATHALTDSVGTFNAPNQVARASLLLTHPTSTSTYVHVTFGNGVREIGAEANSGGSSYRYTGAEFTLPVTYPSTIGDPIQPVFYTTCMNATTACPSSALTFPAVFTGTDGNNYASGGPAGGTGTCTLPTPPPNPITINNCSPGSNWAVNGGGCWMSSRGPASSANADIILACGNGAFACGTRGAGQTGCMNASSGFYWGQSAVQLRRANANNGVASGSLPANSGLTASGSPGTQCLLTFNDGGGVPAGQALVTLPLPTGSTPQPLIMTVAGGTTTTYSTAPTRATASSYTNGTGTAACSGSAVLVSTVIGPVIPRDFFAPNTQYYTCAGPPTSCWDPTPATYQTQELSRVDQDFGTGGVLVIPQAAGVNFIATADKAGFVYVMPPPAGETSGSSLGGFQAGDAGLNGSGLSYTTQPPFRASRLPTDTTICPLVDANGTLSGAGCDEIHELAFDANDNLMFIWPSNETIMAYQGTYTAGTPNNFQFGSRINQCSGGATHCTNFPRAAASSAGGAMAIAADHTTPNGLNCTSPTTTPCIELWSIVPAYQTGLGSLYVYNVPSSGNLAYLWDSSAQACTSPPLSNWYPTAFTEPTLAEIQESATAYGAVYVPTVCGVASGPLTNCDQAGTPVSGVAVYTHCPGQ